MKPRNAALAKIKNIHTPDSVLLEEIIAGPVIAFRRTVLGLSKGLGEAECREIVGRLLNPTQLFLEAEAVIVVALIDDLTVLDPDEGYSLEAERLAGRRVSGPQAPVSVPAKVHSNSTPFRAFDRLGRIFRCDRELFRTP